MIHLFFTSARCGDYSRGLRAVARMPLKAARSVGTRRCGPTQSTGGIPGADSTRGRTTIIMSNPSAILDPSRYGQHVADILSLAEPMPLDAGTIDAPLADKLRILDLEGTLQNGPAAQGCLAGLWLLANDLDSSHHISQELSTPEGSFWHAVMHRREGDYGNAKYWFRRVGHHPVLEALGSAWDPFVFVDQVEACVTRNTGDKERLRELQMREWILLFDHCWNQARLSQ